MSAAGMRRPHNESRENAEDEPLTKREAVAFEDVESRNDAIIEALKCPLCNDLFSYPVTLPQCSHVFCNSCLKSLPLSSGSGQCGLKCPLCFQINQIFACKPNNEIALAISSVRQHKSQLAVSGRQSPGHGDSSVQVCPHLPSRTSDHRKCSHCQHDFCSTCRPLHVENIKKEIFKFAEKTLKNQDSTAGAKMLAIFNQSVYDAELNAKTKLIASVEAFRTKINQTLSEMTVQLGKKITAFGRTCSKNYVPIIRSLNDPETLSSLQEDFGRISNDRDDFSISMDELAKLHAALSDRNTKLSSVAKPTPLFEFVEKLDKSNVNSCCRKIEGVLFGNLNFTVKKLFGQPTKSGGERELQVKTWTDDYHPYDNNCANCGYSQGDVCPRCGYEEEEEPEEEEEEEENNEENCSSEEDDNENDSSGGDDDSDVVIDDDHDCECSDVKPEPEPAVPAVVIIIPDSPPHRPSGVTVNFEYKNLINPKCVALLAKSFDNEFVVLHGSNQLAVFNSKGLRCDVKLQSADLAAGLEIDAICTARNNTRRLYATGSIPSKRLRKIYLVVLALTKTLNSACLYEIAFSNDRGFTTLLPDSSGNTIFTNNGFGGLIALHRPDSQSAMVSFDVGLLGDGFRLLAITKDDQWSILFTRQGHVSSVNIDFKPKNKVKKFALSEKITPVSLPVCQTFSSFGQKVFITNNLTQLQILELPISGYFYSYNALLRVLATHQLPVNGCVVETAPLSLSANKNLKDPYSATSYYMPSSFPAQSTPPISLAILTNNGVVTKVTLPKK